MMIWMLYAVVLGGAVAGGASGVAGALRARGRAERGVWAGALVAAGLLPFALPFLPRFGSTAVAVISLPGIGAGPSDGGAPSAAAPTLETWILLAWGAAVLIMALRLGSATRRLRRIVADSSVLRRWPVEVRRTGGTGPAVAGLRRPAVLLPEWVRVGHPGEWRWVLRHEFEHIRAGDPALVWLALVGRCLLPWNPAIWYLGRRLREGVEFDCDRRVLARRPDPRGYGHTLLSFSTPRPSPGLPVAALREPLVSLERRIRSMTTPRRALPPRALALLAALAAAGWVAACELSPTFVDEADQPEVESQEVPATREMSPDRIAENPTFTPFTTAPDLTNRVEVVSALEREYPAALREAGTGGSANVWLFINASGELQDMRIQESSGHPELDQAALRVAASMQFTPALNRGEPVPVWVAFPITFQAR